MKYVFLRIVLKEAAAGFLLVAMERDKAAGIIQDWMSGQFRLKGGNGIIGDLNCDLPWSVDLNSVSAIHTLAPEEGGGQGIQGRPGPLLPGQFRGTSGVN